MDTGNPIKDLCGKLGPLRKGQTNRGYKKRNRNNFSFIFISYKNGKRLFAGTVLANKNFFAGTPSVGSLNIFHLRTGFFGQKMTAHDVSFSVWVVQYSFLDTS